MSEPFIGQITIFAGTFAPRGWAFCDGQLLPIAQNTALFSLIGTTYGGDGRTTFALPDLRGRFPMHVGASPGPGLSQHNLGEAGGAERVTMTAANLPAHTHDLTMATGPNSGATRALETRLSGGPPFIGPQLVSSAGSNQPVETLNPYLGVNYIIALEGIFPSRN